MSKRWNQKKTKGNRKERLQEENNIKEGERVAEISYNTNNFLIM